MIRLLPYLAWLYIRALVETLWERHSSRFVALLVAGLLVLSLTEASWQDRRFRWFIWWLAVVIVRRRMATGQLSLDDIINDILIEIVISPPFSQ